MVRGEVRWLALCVEPLHEDYVSISFFPTFCFVLFCFVLFCFVLFCFVLFCFVLFCFFAGNSVIMHRYGRSGVPLHLPQHQFTTNNFLDGEIWYILFFSRFHTLFLILISSPLFLSSLLFTTPPPAPYQFFPRRFGRGRFEEAQKTLFHEDDVCWSFMR